MLTILLVSLAGTVLALVVGSLWHTPSFPTGGLHMQYLGFDKLTKEEQEKLMEEAKPKMPKIYFGQTVLSFLTSFAVVFVVTMSVPNGVALWMALLFPVVNWLCFMVPVIGAHILWGNCDPKIAWSKFFSDIVYNLVTVLAIALLASLFV